MVIMMFWPFSSATISFTEARLKCTFFEDFFLHKVNNIQKDSIELVEVLASVDRLSTTILKCKYRMFRFKRDQFHALFNFKDSLEKKEQ